MATTDNEMVDGGSVMTGRERPAGREMTLRPFDEQAL